MTNSSHSLLPLQKSSSFSLCFFFFVFFCIHSHTKKNRHRIAKAKVLREKKKSKAVSQKKQKSKPGPISVRVFHSSSVSLSHSGKNKQAQELEARKRLANIRVIQRYLVYITNIPLSLLKDVSHPFRSLSSPPRVRKKKIPPLEIVKKPISAFATLRNITPFPFFPLVILSSVRISTQMKHTQKNNTHNREGLITELTF